MCDMVLIIPGVVELGADIFNKVILCRRSDLQPLSIHRQSE